MQFSGHMPKFECTCGAIELGGKSGTLVVNGKLMLECQACERVYQFDCRLQEQPFKRKDLVPQEANDDQGAVPPRLPVSGVPDGVAPPDRT